MEIPIHILNNIVEDARENNKELWILFQDMRRAFDSVPLNMLKRLLCRIKIPNHIADFICDMFHQRNTQVLTEAGKTDAFVISKGIDQDEAISPLLWQIFYDPLLERIQKSQDIGYKMSIQIPVNLRNNSFKKIETINLCSLLLMTLSGLATAKIK